MTDRASLLVRLERAIEAYDVTDLDTWPDIAVLREAIIALRELEQERDTANRVSDTTGYAHFACEDQLDAASARIGELENKVRELELELETFALRGPRPDAHVYGCPLDGELKSEPCADCEKALREIHQNWK